jgi:hypothetical protein
VNIAGRVDRFFFRPVTTKGFGLLRIAWASTVFAFMLMQWTDVVADYSNAGVLPIALESLASQSPWHFTILDDVTSPSAVFVLYLLFLVLLVMCAAGVFSRVTTVASVLLLFSFNERNPLLLGGGDTVLRLVGFILAIAPSVSAFSLDRRMDKPSTLSCRETMPMWPVRLLTWQVIVIYGMSVWSKLIGRSWWSGTAIAVALHHPTFARISPVVADRLLPLTPLMTFATLIFESTWLLLLVPRSLLPARLRRIELKRLLIVYGIVFHAAIFVLMDVGSFSIAMIASYCGLLTDEDFSGQEPVHRTAA